MLTQAQQRLEALDALLDDHAVLVAETRARLAWLSAAVRRTEASIDAAAHPDDAASLTMTLVDGARLRGVLAGRLAVYRYYQRILEHRRAELVDAG